LCKEGINNLVLGTANFTSAEIEGPWGFPLEEGVEGGVGVGLLFGEEEGGKEKVLAVSLELTEAFNWSW
jgi:hypothetical protein